MSEQSRLRRRAILLSAACAFGCLTALITPQAEAQKPVTSSSKPAAKTLPPGALEVQLVEIADRAGFGRPMTAARVLVPVGWRTEGGVSGAGARLAAPDPATFGWSAVSPDGRPGSSSSPSEIWKPQQPPGPVPVWRVPGHPSLTSPPTCSAAIPARASSDTALAATFLDAQKEYLQAKIAMTNNSGLGMHAWADAGELSYSQPRTASRSTASSRPPAMFYAAQAWDPSAALR